MKALALMLGSVFVTYVGFYARSHSRNVGSWLATRRIDNNPKINRVVCEACGGAMHRRTYKSGHRKGCSALVCENYPQCRHRIWG